MHTSLVDRHLPFFRVVSIWLFASFLLPSCHSEPEAPELSRPLDEVIVRLEAEPDQLNPVFATMAASMQVYDQLFSYLLHYDPQSRQLAPQLAEARPRVRLLEEGPQRGMRAFDFRIHDAAVWDDGEPITGHDFAFTLKVLFNPAVPAARYRAYLSFIRDLQVSPSDPKAFTVVADAEFMQAEEYMATSIPVLPARHYDPEALLQGFELSQLLDPARSEELARDSLLLRFAEYFAQPSLGREPEKVVGSGPYRLVGWASGSSIRLEKKEDWWGQALADDFPLLRNYPQALIYRIIPDGGTTVAALRATDIDVAVNLPPTQFVELRESPAVAGQYRFFTPPQNAYFFLYVNQRRPLLEDRRVREALALAIDVDAIIEGVYRGFGERLAGPVLPSAPFSDPDLQPYPFDPEQAARLLAEAGWDDSDNNGILERVINGETRELRLEYMFTAQRETSRNMALLIQDDLRAVGIELELTPREASELFSRLRARDYDLVSAGRTLPLDLWNPKQEFHREGDNRTGFGNNTTDNLIDEILTTTDEDRRLQLYRDLQRIIYREVPEIPLFTPTARIAIHRRFEPVLGPIYPHVLVSRFKLKAPYL